MKFLCVSCDRPMKFQRAEGPLEGSLTAVFQCPQCARETALLLNPWETQLVSSLDVKVGGKSVSLEEKPLEMAQTYVEGTEVEGNSAEGDANVFAKMFSSKSPSPLRGEGGGEGEKKGKCPFGAVAAQMTQGQPEVSSVPWTSGAASRLERIPAFVRPMAKAGIEKFAAENGYAEVNDEVMDAAKEKFGM